MVSAKRHHHIVRPYVALMVQPPGVLFYVFAVVDVVAHRCDKRYIFAFEVFESGFHRFRTVDVVLFYRALNVGNRHKAERSVACGFEGVNVRPTVFVVA